MSKKEKKTAEGKKTHRLRKVLLIILVALAALILGSFAACKVMSIPGEPVVEQYADADEQSAAAASAGEPIAAQEALKAPEGEIYQSISSMGWKQTGDVYGPIEDSSWYEAAGATMGGEVDKSAAGCFDACHRSSAFNDYRVPYEEARATIQRMVDDYGCELTSEEVESFAKMFTEE